MMTDFKAPPTSLLGRVLRSFRALLKNNWDWRFRGVNPARQHVFLDETSFDAEFYLENNPDVRENGGDPFRHFLEHGIYENRSARFFDTHWYLGRYADLRLGRLDAYTHFRLFGAQENRTGQFISFQTQQVRQNNNNYQEWIDHFDAIGKAEIKYLREDSANLNAHTLAVFIVATNQATTTDFSLTLESLMSQVRPANEIWCFTNSSKAANDIATSKAINGRIFIRDVGESLPRALNSALAETKADYAMIVESGDSLGISALYWIAKSAAERPEAEIFYTDEDHLDAAGKRANPVFKPQPNPELMLTHNLFGHLVAYRVDFLRLINGFDEKAEDAFEYELALRASENVTNDLIVHIPRPLYHNAKARRQFVSTAHLRAISHHIERRNLSGEVGPAPGVPGFSRVRFDLPENLPLVSILIPTRDRLDILRVCIETLLHRTTYPKIEIIVIDNGSEKAETLDYLDKVSRESGVVVLRDNRPFNFSALNNLAVAAATGDYVCLMNNDIEVVTPDWVQEMLSFAQQPDVGCVGAKLWYPDGTLQHGGVLVGFHGAAGHLHKALPRGEAGYHYRACLHQALSAVTAACLLVRKSIYEEVGGLDEAFAVAFNDVDFCLKVKEAGYRNVYTPYAEMIHYESASRGAVTSPKNAERELREVNLLKSRWQGKLDNDPAYNPNLTLTLEDCSLAWPPRVPTITQLRDKFYKSPSRYPK